MKEFFNAEFLRGVLTLFVCEIVLGAILIVWIVLFSDSDDKYEGL